MPKAAALMVSSLSQMISPNIARLNFSNLLANKPLFLPDSQPPLDKTEQEIPREIQEVKIFLSRSWA